MGLLEFVKDAGRKLGLTSGAPSPDALREEVGKLGLAVRDINVSVAGDVVTIRGSAESDADREKAVLAVGNIQGVATVKDEMVVEPPAAAASPAAVSGSSSGGAEAPSQSEFYTVSKGDTLSKIAKQFYGDPNKYNAIFEANRPMLEHPDRIYPGQMLRIPEAKTVKA